MLGLDIGVWDISAVVFNCAPAEALSDEVNSSKAINIDRAIFSDLVSI